MSLNSGCFGQMLQWSGIEVMVVAELNESGIPMGKLGSYDEINDDAACFEWRPQTMLFPEDEHRERTL